MRYSERLLKELDEEIARRRRNIERLACSIDAIGEFLSVAHCAGVDLRLIDPLGGGLQLGTRNHASALHFLNAHGITPKLLGPTPSNLLYSLALPGVERPVFFIVPPQTAKTEGLEQPRLRKVAA
ncbi:hypothetical protein BL241_08160 [Ralstonia solanacearum]|uniref:Uncharacterized protein n=1 Tax=Ralstonia solanacearum TaxID=305 RepID=A0A0S4UE01_RALSL|nr:hypothetical protein BL241_08160 [Ralstonia solanacearum]CUV20419.1 conserved protein of unknown function [Ralstonia solanacearum]